MSEKRTLTIGVAINLGNYESLRLEVIDEAQSEKEAAELAAYLSRILDGYGQNDPATRASIGKYRTRVLEKYSVVETTAPAADPLDERLGPVPVYGDSVKKKGKITSGSMRDDHSPSVPESTISTPEPIDPTPVKAEHTPSVPKPTVYICEKCGATVSKVQRDVSNLFMGKTLCKACMK
ncbi:MAG: hypothetical protein LBU24_03040 [Methanocalculaceae archaeon]|jgi:hypothetical protein|nr:hypothetical protein [Methanocalculaceae archaeon]